MEHLIVRSRQTKNIIFFTIVLLMSSVIAVSYTNNLKLKIDDSMDLLLEKQSIFEEQLHILQSRHLLLRDIVSTEDPFIKDEMIQQHANLATRYYSLIRRLDELQLSPAEADFLGEQVRKTRSAYRAQMDLIEASIVETRPEHYRTLLEDIYPLTSQAYDNIRDYKKVMEDETRAVIEQAQTRYKEGWHLILAIYVIAAILVTATFIWVSIKQRSMNRELHWKASHDNLTRLCNRAEFERLLADVLSYHERDAVNSILYIDLDEFKVVNDSCGHMAGDELLIEIANILKRNTRRHDVVARVGGDEFSILLMGCKQHEAVEVAEKIRKCVHEFDFVRDGTTYNVGTSIGVMEIPQDIISIKEILKRVDTVCYTAKSSGRNRVRVFSLEDEPTIRRIDEIDTAEKIRNALDDQRFRLYHQRFGVLNDSLPPNSEILVRMLDEHDRIITPDRFIPSALRFHLMHRIDCRVLKHTLEYLCERPDDTTRYHINLSAQTLNDDDCLEYIVDMITTSGVDASRICFEITEDSAIANLQKTVVFMDRLHGMGCHFALDDFGTGLSSFTYLQKLPVDTLKIDGSFVLNLREGSYEHCFIEAMCSISRNLDIHIVAEWVEDEHVLELLRKLGIDYAQGYLIARPMPLEPDLAVQTRAAV